MSASKTNSLRSFWYIACQSKDLGNKPKAISILGKHLALFRGSENKVVAIEDRCLHRNAKLSEGRVKDGCIVCPYHGWSFDSTGEVKDIPSEGGCLKKKRKQKTMPVIEQQDYIYVWLGDEEPTKEQKPFDIPHYSTPGFHKIKLINYFESSVTNCVENFIDIPHTVFVHPGIFRVRKDQKIVAVMKRDKGSVEITYSNETDNLGFFSRFINPESKEIVHFDRFHMPNITCVEYYVSKNRHFIITSQSVPIGDNETMVYTDLTYNYGVWNKVASPLIRQQAQQIIAQDQVILKNQKDNIARFGESFQNSPADTIHVLVESIRHCLEKGKDPLVLSTKSKEIEFWI